MFELAVFGSREKVLWPYLLYCNNNTRAMYVTTAKEHTDIYLKRDSTIEEHFELLE